MQFLDWTSIHLGEKNYGGFVIPISYLVGIVLTSTAYYIAFRGHNLMQNADPSEQDKVILLET